MTNPNLSTLMQLNNAAGMLSGLMTAPAASAANPSPISRAAQILTDPVATSQALQTLATVQANLTALQTALSVPQTNQTQT